MFKKSIIKLALASSFLLPLGVLPKEAIASGTRRISTNDAQGKTLQLLVYPGDALPRVASPRSFVDSRRSAFIIASGTRRISSSDAQGLNGRTIQLSIHPGYDLTIDFLELNEIIVDATPGDPSNFTFNGLVGNLCPKLAPVQCEGNGSRLIRIRQIKPIKFDNITSSPDGRTSLTLVTQGELGYTVYKFILKKGQGVPPVDHVKVTPDPEKLPLTLSEEELERARERWNGNKSNCKPRKIHVALSKVVEGNTKGCDSI